MYFKSFTSACPHKICFRDGLPSVCFELVFIVRLIGLVCRQMSLRTLNANKGKESSDETSIVFYQCHLSDFNASYIIHFHASYIIHFNASYIILLIVGQTADNLAPILMLAIFIGNILQVGISQNIVLCIVFKQYSLCYFEFFHVENDINWGPDVIRLPLPKSHDQTGLQVNCNFLDLNDESVLTMPRVRVS